MKEVDIAPCGVAMTHSKYHKVDFSVPWLMAPNRLVVPWPNKENNQHNFSAAIQPFQPMVC